MKKIMLFFFSVLVIATTGFAENLMLNNRTPYPDPAKKAKMAIQWATSAQEVKTNNSAVVSGEKLNPKTMQPLSKQGTINLSIPKKAEYFRVLVWSKGDGEPDLLTNWVDVIPNKTYTLQEDHLVPTVLMIGMGC